MNEESYFLMIGFLTFLFVVATVLTKNETLIAIMIPLITFASSALMYIRKTEDMKMSLTSTKYYRALHPSETLRSGQSNAKNQIYNSETHHEINNSLEIIKTPTPGHVSITPKGNDPNVADHTKTLFNPSISIDDDFLDFKVKSVERTEYSATLKYTIAFKGTAESLRFGSYTGETYNTTINKTDNYYLTNPDFEKNLTMQDIVNINNNCYSFRIFVYRTQAGSKYYLRTYDIVIPVEKPEYDELSYNSYTPPTSIDFSNYIYDHNNEDGCSSLKPSVKYQDEFDAEHYCLNTLTECRGFEWHKKTFLASFYYDCDETKKTNIILSPTDEDSNIVFISNELFQEKLTF